ncbi:MAG: 3-dehydroquinate synthase [Spirochaetes bacterium]|nr:3-dehydroquinate synthase [Spirochaetota bacterium]
MNNNKSLNLDFGFKKSCVIIEKRLKTPEVNKDNSLFVFDSNTVSLFKNKLFGEKTKKYAVLQPGEIYKNWESAAIILDHAVEHRLGRDAGFIGVGGGVVCDLTAFAASVYMRGCPLILIPTTFLSMVDAAIGGKTGFNYKDLKNTVGTFYPADSIYIFIDVLKSLSEREYRSGLAEVIKTAMLGDAGLFSLLENRKEDILIRDEDLMEDVIKRCVSVKGRIVEEDLREHGKRATLNLGHTFGHALESVTGFKSITHGEAVAWGLAMAVKLGVSIGAADREYQEKVLHLLSLYDYKLKFDAINADAIVDAMLGDKKKRNGKLRFVVQKNLCDTYIVEITGKEITRFLELV